MLPYLAGALGLVALLNLAVDVGGVELVTMLLAVAVIALVLSRPLARVWQALVVVLAPPARWLAAKLRALLAPIVRTLFRPAQSLDRRCGSPLQRLITKLRERPSGELIALRLLVWLVIVVLTLGALVLFVLLATAILGKLLGGRTTPFGAEWLYVGAAISASLIVAVIAFIVWTLGLVFRRRWTLRGVLVPALVLLMVGGIYLSSKPVPAELSWAEGEATRGAGSLHDVLVVVDPADPAGVELSRFAAGNLWTVSRKRADTVPYDVAFAVAAPADLTDRAASEPWLFLEPPTKVRRHFLDSVAAIEPDKPRPATGAYSSLLSSLRASVDFEWRRGARRTVALVLDTLPSEAALDRRDVPGGREVPSWRALVAMASTDRAAEPPPERYARIVVATREQRPRRLSTWQRYLDEIGGRLISYEAIDASVLYDIEDAATGAPTSDLRALARRFSPRLRFDSDEQFVPVEVDQFLEKGGHQVCRRARFADTCDSIENFQDLLDRNDEYIDFEGGAWLGRDLFDRDNRLRLRRRIYVQVVEDDARLHLSYWWFIRYNVSPVEPERNCLPGFTVAEATCFDHEGDWEGVTVTLGRSGTPPPHEPYAVESWRPESASFASHAQNVRWDWDALELEETHPVVYVALGSHAAYPAPCTASVCNQRLAGKGLPEGRFDGRLPWPHDDVMCCLPLPVTPEGSGALWNAFRGRWGKAQCIVFVKICSQADGPKSPSLQRRFSHPQGATFPRQETVLAEHRARFSSSAPTPITSTAASTR